MSRLTSASTSTEPDARRSTIGADFVVVATYVRSRSTISRAFGPGGVTLMSGTFNVAPEAWLAPGRINNLVAENLRCEKMGRRGLLRGADSHDRCATDGTFALHRGLAVLQFHGDRVTDLPLGSALHAITLHHGGITARAQPRTTDKHSGANPCRSFSQESF